MDSGTLLQTHKSGDLIYDVGMHHGEDTDFYLRKGFRVVGFEALPENVELCQARFPEFVQTGQLVIVEGAIITPEQAIQRPGRVSFYRNEKHSVWGTANSEWAERNRKLGTPSTVLEVEAVSFEDALLTHGMPYYMKVDIEGSDMACINALARFAERPDYVSLESNKMSIAEVKREIATLKALGYSGFQSVEQSSVPTLHRPPFPAREGKYVDHTFAPGSSGLFGSELPGTWSSANRTLFFYGIVHLGYLLLGDSGSLNRLSFPGAWRLRSFAKWCFARSAGGPVPGWYDTHARHSSVSPEPTGEDQLATRTAW